MENIFNICKYIILYEKEQGKSVTNLRLQKLLYFIQANCIKTLKQPCFDDRIEAWRYGPVVPDVYHEYKFYGNLAIGADINVEMNNLIKSKDIQKSVDEVLYQTRELSTQQLIDITHRQRPWMEAYKDGAGYGSEITQKILSESFSDGKE